MIEDNPVNLELVTDLLEAAGFNVLSAPCAEAGIAMARQENPHLILMDISLPGMDGLAATRQLKADGKTAHIPVVALTAHAMPGDEQIAMEAGCVAQITKPIDTRHFASRVRGFLIQRESSKFKK